MSDNQILGSTHRSPVFQNIHLKRIISLLTFMSLILFLVPEIIHARHQRVINQDLFSASFSTDRQG